MTDFRALCAELLDEVPHESPLTCLARAALAQPEPQRPTDEEIEAWYADCIKRCNYRDKSCFWIFDTCNADITAIVRAIIDRWGGSAPCPYVVSSDEGTSYCRLAEHTADQLAKLPGEGGG